MNASKADIESYSGLITVSLDRSKKAISEKKKIREALTKSLRLLARYVEIMCKNDMPTSLSSGFEAAATTRTPAQPLPPPSIITLPHAPTPPLPPLTPPLPPPPPPAAPPPPPPPPPPTPP